MNDIATQQIGELRDDLVDFLPHCSYTMQTVTDCIGCLRTYITCLQSANDATDAMKCVERVVLKLNDLNEKADFTLIETGQRESLWEIIQTVYEERFVANTNDITEEFREW